MNLTDPIKTNCFVAELRHEGDTEQVTEESRANLEVIGRSLHSGLIPSTDHELFSKSQHANPGGQSLEDLESKDQTVFPLESIDIINVSN